MLWYRRVSIQVRTLNSLLSVEALAESRSVDMLAPSARRHVVNERNRALLVTRSNRRDLLCVPAPAPYLAAYERTGGFCHVSGV